MRLDLPLHMMSRPLLRQTQQRDNAWLVLLVNYGNCWLYAIPRFLAEGGYLVVRWSPRNRLVPHVAYSPDLDMAYEFVPLTPRRGIHGMLASICFRGRVRKVPIGRVDDTFS